MAVAEDYVIHHNAKFVRKKWHLAISCLEFALKESISNIIHNHAVMLQDCKYSWLHMLLKLWGIKIIEEGIEKEIYCKKS